MRYLFILLLWLPLCSDAQKRPWHTFQDVTIGMQEEQAEKTFRKQWTPIDTFDTGVFRTYFVLSPNDRNPAPGSFRFLFYYFNKQLQDKELRISTTATQVRHVLDSVKQVLVKAYGKPQVEADTTHFAVEGTAKYSVWTFQNAKTNEIYRIDLAVYKLKTRKDYTILIAGFSREYNKLFPVRNYLHI
jgi:hypothetical protein